MPSAVPSTVSPTLELRSQDLTELEKLTPVKAGDLLRFIREEMASATTPEPLAPYESALIGQLNSYRVKILAGNSAPYTAFSNIRDVDTFFEIAGILYRHGSPAVSAQVGNEMRTICRQLPASTTATIPTNTYSTFYATGVLNSLAAGK